VLRFTSGVLIGVAASAVAIFLHRSFEKKPLPSSADQRLADERVVAAVRVPSAPGKRVLSTTCTATAWSLCVVTVFVPEPLDACQDWSASVHDHFVTGLRFLQTRTCP
jgi:cytochrome c5